MEFYQTLMARSSVRSYEDRPIPRELLARLLEAAREAPSANNLMPWRLVLVSDPAARAELARGGPYAKFLDQCPLVVIGAGDQARSPEWYEVDTTIALEHLALAASAEGLGSCWVGSFDEAMVRRLVGLPAAYKVVSLLALGYPRKRVDLLKLASHLIHPTKKLQDLVSEGSFDRPWQS